MRALLATTVLIFLWVPPAFGETRCGATAPSAPRLTLAFDIIHNPPYIVGEGTTVDRDRPGRTVELLCMAAAQIGAAVDYTRAPWSRALHLLEFNQIDGLFHASFTPDRLAIGVYPMAAGQLDPSRAIFIQSYYLYVATNSPVRWDGSTLSGLADKPIGIARGYAIGKELQAQGLAIDEEISTDANFRKLLAGRVSAVAELEGIADTVLQGMPERSLISKLPVPLRTKPYYLLLSHGFVAAQPDLAERLWDAIRTVNGSAAFAAVRAKYETAP